MSGKRNVSVCRGHELANALYSDNEFLIRIITDGSLVHLAHSFGFAFSSYRDVYTLLTHIASTLMGGK